MLERGRQREVMLERGHQTEVTLERGRQTDDTLERGREVAVIPEREHFNREQRFGEDIELNGPDKEVMLDRAHQREVTLEGGREMEVLPERELCLELRAALRSPAVLTVAMTVRRLLKLCMFERKPLIAPLRSLGDAPSEREATSERSPAVMTERNLLYQKTLKTLSAKE